MLWTNALRPTPPARWNQHPDLDLHLRIQEHRLEGYGWCDGRRLRILGVRDEEELTDH
jgi:hypothetical protein